MMPEPSHHKLALRDPAQAVDRGMLLLQYATAAVATLAAVVLGVFRQASA